MTVSTTTAKSGPYAGSGTTGPFTVGFRFLENSHILVVKNVAGVETNLVLDTDYTVTGAGASSGSVTLATALATGQTLTIVRNVPTTQETDYVAGDSFPAESHERALDQLTMIAQQLKEEVDRSAKLPVSSTADADALVTDIIRLADSADEVDAVAGIEASVVTVAGIDSEVATVAGIAANVTTVAGVAANVTSVAGNATNINTVAGISANVTTVAAISAAVTAVAADATDIGTVAADIADINTCADNMAAILDAPAQASAAAASASSASASVASAAASAASAAASAASGMYSAVQDKSANYTVVAGDAGDLIRVTTTSGAVTITLPAISTVSDGFKVAIVKWTGDSNQVTIARSSSNTINGGTSATIGAQYTQTTFVADFQTNQWFASTSGLGSTNVVVDAFSGNGSTTAFTLSGDAGTENNTQVFVGGIYQEKDTYSLSGTTLTFSSAPPSGTSNIEVVWTQPLPVGTPSDGTVTPAKLSTGGPYWNSNGYVGLGTTIPTYAFDLQTETVNGDVLARIKSNNNAGGTDADASLVFDAGALVTSTVTAGSFSIGTQYRIESVGTTDFTLVGALNNTVGVLFTATGAGSGTGTAATLSSGEAQLSFYTGGYGRASVHWGEDSNLLVIDANAGSNNGSIRLTADGGNGSVQVYGNNTGLTGASATNILRFIDGDTGTAANQALGMIDFYSGDTSNGVGVASYILSTAAASSGGADLRFGTAPAGANGSPVERMRIDSVGSRTSVIPSGSTLLPAFDCRAWVNFDGTTNTGGFCTVRGSGNVSSVADNGTGAYTVNLATAMPDANYAVTIGTSRADGIGGTNGQPTSTSFGVNTRNGTNSQTDTTGVFAAAFR